ncbi:TetR family transcriptional regulator [Sphingobium sp. TA15]|uniref:TetR-family transcriptional regulator n=1 Tax=Sphingobium indicum (strain DSM 16413 / CCM 7287 / MTCC 6362 / UT26 / NBRC 101211 / UT26S) TaxID=452662 RepID=D4Z4K3_SPHIU|nr:TetR/AcrR family transcriptional regulator [Sphingobium indicum]BAI97535.1 TetR-family transcriptional regulator [Sphingobium indicum UT26S]BDD66946.1 TetR family transcriptional regulator [Sphingobium sp. TA15]
MSQTPGRSRIKVGRDELLAVAAKIFFEQGYAATRIDDIIERTGGSKRNIYAEFGNKEGLFAAIVSEQAGQALAPLAIDNAAGQKLEEVLLDFGRRLIDIYMSPALLGVYRIAITECARFPELVRRFYDLGPGRAGATLADVLRAAKARGEIQTDDCAVAGDHFVSMIRGNMHLHVMLGLRDPPDAQERRQFVASVVDLFLNGLVHARPEQD